MTDRRDFYIPRRIQLVQARCLMARSKAGLSTFEVETVEDVLGRVAADPDAVAAVTDPEWIVVEAVIAALRPCDREAAA